MANSQTDGIPRTPGRQTPAGALAPRSTFSVTSLVVLGLAAAWCCGCRDVTAPTAEGPPSEVPATPRLAMPAPRGSGYVGSASCAECHPEIAEEYRSHPMAQSLFAVLDAPLVEDYSEETSFSPVPSRRYRVERTADAIYHREVGLDAEDQPVYDHGVQVHYALGSGRRGRSYLINREGFLHLSPIAWHTKDRRWGLARGYPPGGHPRFEGKATDRCLNCHSGQMAEAVRRTSEPVLRYEEPAFVELAIGCERCHGPGEEHVRYHEASETPAGEDPIVKLLELDPPRRDSVCSQCHLPGEHVVLRYGRTAADFRPGDHLGDIWSVFVGETPASQVEQMQESACYRGSNREMGCVSCHASHSVPAEAEKDAFHRGRCLGCHEENGCSLPAAKRQEPPASGSCIACHMPRLEADDDPHATRTDHRVLRAPSPLESHRGDPATLRVFDVAASQLPDLEAMRARGLMLASRAGSPPNVDLARQAESLLAKVLEAAPEDAELLSGLATASVYRGDPQDAIRYWQKALAVEPDRREVLHSLALICYGARDVSRSLEYVQRLLTVDPWRAELHERHARLLVGLGRRDLAIEAARQSVQLDPSRPRTHEYLAELYQLEGEAELAEQCREVARRLTPQEEEDSSDSKADVRRLGERSNERPDDDNLNDRQ